MEIRRKLVESLKRRSDSKSLKISTNFKPIEVCGVTYNVSTIDSIYGDTFWEKVQAGKYEPDTFSFLLRSVDSDTLFIDVGAAIGAMTLFVAHLGSSVIAIEPHPKIFNILAKNVSLNPSVEKTVSLVKGALGVNTLILTDFEKKHPTLTPIVFNNSPRSDLGSVQVYSIHDLMERIDQQKIAYKKILIKMDIEGAEWAMFQSSNFLNFCTSRSILILLAVHPGLDRPYKDKDNFALHLCILAIWRIRNIFQLIAFFRKINQVSRIYRTNNQIVTKLHEFVSLCMGGYHEFIIDFALAKN